MLSNLATTQLNGATVALLLFWCFQLERSPLKNIIPDFSQLSFRENLSIFTLCFPRSQLSISSAFPFTHRNRSVWWYFHLSCRQPASLKKRCWGSLDEQIFPVWGKLFAWKAPLFLGLEFYFWDGQPKIVSFPSQINPRYGLLFSGESGKRGVRKILKLLFVLFIFFFYFKKTLSASVAWRGLWQILAEAEPSWPKSGD